MVIDSFAHVGVGGVVDADVGFGQGSPVKGFLQYPMVIQGRLDLVCQVDDILVTAGVEIGPVRTGLVP